MTKGIVVSATSTAPTTATVIGPDDGRWGGLITCGVRFMVDGETSGGGFSLVEHDIPPRTLVAPLHFHTYEDEYTYVTQGRIGALLGDDVVYGEPGDLIFKPRGQWHTFWNAGDEPARMLEIISPAGFEKFFAQLVELPRGEDGMPDFEQLAALGARYGHKFQPESVPVLLERFGLEAAPVTGRVVSGRF
jgi:quercetin dioxygenase-like cupin family protein